MLKKSLMLPIFLGSLWLTGAVKGMTILWDYQNAPGKPGVPPARWPSGSRVPGPVTQPMLVMLVHPHCPCSRASIGELALLMTRLRGRLSACVLFIQPEGSADSWEKTDLWRSASAIPGVLVLSDKNNIEARRFGAATSGQTVIYDERGHLLFSGGITPSRGHWGVSEGFQAIVSRISKGKAERSRLPVYGCALDTPLRLMREEPRKLSWKR